MKGGEKGMVLLASEFDKSRFLKAADLDKEKKFRISKVAAEVLGQGDDKERKPVVWFTNDERGLVLNKTNLRALRDAFGDNMEAWAGKVIVVFPTMVDLRGRMTPALRVRIPPPKQTTMAGNGQATAASPQPKPKPTAPPKSTTEQLDEFGQSQSSEKPSLSEDLNDEINF
jgi:hypothetical protein